MPAPTTIAAYIKEQPRTVQPILRKIHETMLSAAPDATEAMSYGMPTLKLNGKNLVHFAAWKEHVGFYATPSGNAAFQKQISRYKGAKGSIQFPLNEPMPYALIKKMTAFRVKEVAAKFAATKSVKRSAPTKKTKKSA